MNPLEQIVKAVLERAAKVGAGEVVSNINAATVEAAILALPADQIAAEVAHLWPGAIKGGENNA